MTEWPQMFCRAALQERRTFVCLVYVLRSSWGSVPTSCLDPGVQYWHQNVSETHLQWADPASPWTFDLTATAMRPAMTQTAHFHLIQWQKTCTTAEWSIIWNTNLSKLFAVWKPTTCPCVWEVYRTVRSLQSRLGDPSIHSGSTCPLLGAFLPAVTDDTVTVSYTSF